MLVQNEGRVGVDGEEQMRGCILTVRECAEEGGAGYKC